MISLICLAGGSLSQGTRDHFPQIKDSFTYMTLARFQLSYSDTYISRHLFISNVWHDHSYQYICLTWYSHSPHIAITPGISKSSIRSMLSHNHSTLTKHSLIDPISSPLTRNWNSLSFISNPNLFQLHIVQCPRMDKLIDFAILLLNHGSLLELRMTKR